MAIRDLTDAAGPTWQVWETVPETTHEESLFRPSTRPLDDAERRADAAGEPEGPRRGRFSHGREDGLLTFAAGEEKRRLSPIPPHWAEATDTDLAAYLARAQPVHLNDRAARMLAQPPRPSRPEEDTKS